jgi:hypothetical protein
MPHVPLSAIANSQSVISSVGGSLLWQGVFISFAVVLISFEVVHGWRLGLIRQLIRIVALAAAYAAGLFGGRLLLPVERSLFKMPDVMLSILGGAVLALSIYGLITCTGMILFKRTGQQSSKVLRLLYGCTGAVLGLFFGAFFLWMVVAGVRAIGAVADAQVHRRASSVDPGESTTIRALNVRRRFLGESDEESTTLATSLARLRNSLEIGPMGNAVKKMDPVPVEIYETLWKVGSVISSPERAQRFLTFPGARALSEHPKIVALREDPEISEMIRQRRFLDLLQNPHVIDAANDQTLATRIKKFDLQRALDYALQQK